MNLKCNFYLFQKGLSFLNNDGNVTHFNICACSIYVTSGGEWKIGGVEYISQENNLYPVKILPQLNAYNPPEKSNPAKMRVTTKWYIFNSFLGRHEV